jgi:hypothetical protein
LVSDSAQWSLRYEQTNNKAGQLDVLGDKEIQRSIFHQHNLNNANDVA